MSRDIELEALAKGLVNAKQDTHGWPTVEYLRGAQDAGKEMLAILAKPSPGTLHGELRELADKKAWDVASHIWTDILRQRGEYEGWFDDQVAAKELILSAFLASHPAPDMQSIMKDNGHPDEGPCVVCGAIFDTHFYGCVFDKPALAPSREDLLKQIEANMETIRRQEAQIAELDKAPAPLDGTDEDAEVSALLPDREAVALFLHNWCACKVSMDICRQSADRILALIAGGGLHSEERAYSMLEAEGVSKERARSVANGIAVLGTRYRKQIADMQEALSKYTTATLNLLKIVDAIPQDVGDESDRVFSVGEFEELRNALFYASGARTPPQKQGDAP